MLYEAAMASIKMAKTNLEAHNLPAKGKYLGKAISIVNELRVSLNLEQGGEIAFNLDRLYDYVTEQLTQANIQNKTEPLDVSLKILAILYEGWTGIFKGQALPFKQQEVQPVP
jgi:flagellar protein FliS